MHDALVAIAWRVLRDTAAAEDVVQDVFLELWCPPARLRPGARRAARRTCGCSCSTVPWTDGAREWSRSAAVERAQAQAAPGPPADDSAAERVIRRETARAVRAAVDALPPPQREAILLAYGSGLSTPEVATRHRAPRWARPRAASGWA